MKQTPNILTVVCILLFICSFQSNAQIPSASLKKDTVSTSKNVTSEELYALEAKMAEKLTALKYDAATKQSKVEYPSDNSGSVAKVVLYYLGNRLIRLEKRIYDQTNAPLSYSMYTFNEKNACFCNTQWNQKDGKTQFLTKSDYGLIYFDSDMKLIELAPAQMDKLVQESKDSLDGVMTHFKDFKYTFEMR